MFPHVYALIDWSDTFTIGNITTIVAIILAGYKLNATFVTKFAQLELKVETMWERYLKGRD